MPVDRAETVVSRREFVKTVEVRKKIIEFEATVSTNDTVTIGEVTTVASAHLAKKSDSSEVTCTVATNVITVTGTGLTNVDIVGVAVEG